MVSVTPMNSTSFSIVGCMTAGPSPSAAVMAPGTAAMQAKKEGQEGMEEAERKGARQRDGESKKGGDLECLKESFELDYQKALGEDVLQKISNQRAIDVGLIEAESAATCRRIDDTTRLEAEKIKGESKLKSTVAKVDVEGDALFMGASSDLTCAQNQSSGEKGENFYG